MKTKRQKGFTLIELLIGMATGLIVLLGAGGILVVGNNFWENAWDKVNLQRDASYAMLTISRSVRSGKSAELENGGKGIKIYRETDWIRFYLDSAKNDIKCEIEGESPQTVVATFVEELTFTLDADIVEISIKLQRDNFQNHFASTAMMRNFGG